MVPVGVSADVERIGASLTYAGTGRGVFNQKEWQALQDDPSPTIAVSIKTAVQAAPGSVPGSVPEAQQCHSAASIVEPLLCGAAVRPQGSAQAAAPCTAPPAARASTDASVRDRLQDKVSFITDFPNEARNRSLTSPERRRRSVTETLAASPMPAGPRQDAVSYHSSPTRDRRRSVEDILAEACRAVTPTRATRPSPSAAQGVWDVENANCGGHSSKADHSLTAKLSDQTNSPGKSRQFNPARSIDDILAQASQMAAKQRQSSQVSAN